VKRFASQLSRNKLLYIAIAVPAASLACNFLIVALTSPGQPQGLLWNIARDPRFLWDYLRNLSLSVVCLNAFLSCFFYANLGWVYRKRITGVALYATASAGILWWIQLFIGGIVNTFRLKQYHIPDVPAMFSLKAAGLAAAMFIFVGLLAAKRQKIISALCFGRASLILGIYFSASPFEYDVFYRSPNNFALASYAAIYIMDVMILALFMIPFGKYAESMGENIL
jgi:hypothetical protein